MVEHAEECADACEARTASDEWRCRVICETSLDVTSASWKDAWGVV